MSGQQWIIVPNWDSFQHYKDRVPNWIKLYTAELLHDPGWEGLSAGSRGTLVTIWVEYALHKGQLSTEVVSKSLGRSYKVAYLDLLNEAGFIELSASKPLALTRSREVEKKKKEEKSAGASERAVDNSSRPRQENKTTAYQRAENMTRNAGWQYEPPDFLAELEKFDLDPGQRHDLEQLRLSLVNGANNEDDW